jgi:serine/threonine protein kinase/tetratricopeptide (TPR) repeat protein
MMDDQSRSAKAIFLEAIDEQAPEQWQAFLEQACAGDVVLRAEVEKLLRAQAAMGSFHETPRATLPAPVEAPIRERPGAVIGAYKLMEQIGEGGFGIVFMAEQTQPVHRKVALKVVKPGMDSKQVLARFEAERQALAIMDHPNIARVLDAGTTDSGRPWFVMELVKGMPITDFCDKTRLPPEARLKLFLDVCAAVQHAHQKGIIHRDIKPSNVLVTMQDGKPLVKVIDFGIAKALAQKLTERTLFTASGQMMGTPAYMSPEQAGMSGLDVDTRTDVYALGVLLYELLTGTTPLDIARLHEAPYVEIQRLIREEEASRPSTRLSSLGDSATVLAGNRGLDVKRLTQLLAGDLDQVVMKALEKDRNRRYDTPGHFAEDVERYLRREAILARPPSRVYRVKKFAQRHRAAVLTGAAIAAALLVGLAVATWQAVRATDAEAAALATAEAYKQAKEDAEAREAETKAVLRFVENQVFFVARPKGQAGGLGRAVTLRQALEAALPFVEKCFTNEPLIEARLRLSLGTSFAYLGEDRIAAQQFARARALYARHRGPEHPDTLASMNNLANSYAALGRHADASELYTRTLTIHSARLGPDHPTTLMSMNNLANSYQSLGRHADALALHERTLELRKARLGPTHPDTLGSMNNLANSYAALGRHADAFRLRERTLELRKARLGPEHPDTLASMSNLASSHAALGRHTAALALREQTLELKKARLGPDHPVTLWSMNSLALSYVALGRHTDALRLLEQTLALRKARLGPDHPDTLVSMWGVADSLVKLDRGVEAVPVIDECAQRAAGKVVHPGLLQGLMDLRLRHFSKSKDATGCRQTAETWENLKRTDANSLYNAGRYRAVTAAVFRAAEESSQSGQRAAAADAEADRAMAWLKQAIAAGYKNAARLKQDKALDALRNRADFTRLVAMLEGMRD